MKLTCGNSGHSSFGSTLGIVSVDGQRYHTLPFAGGKDLLTNVSPPRTQTLCATSQLPFDLSATNSEFVHLTKWHFSLLEIYFEPQWECISLGKLMVQIRLLEACLDYLETCSQGTGWVAVHTCQQTPLLMNPSSITAEQVAVLLA